MGVFAKGEAHSHSHRCHKVPTTRSISRGAYISQLTTKSSKARALVVTSYTKAKEVDEKHHILSRAKAAPPALG